MPETKKEEKGLSRVEELVVAGLIGAAVGAILAFLIPIDEEVSK